jgi:hypothetical protein
MVTVPTFGYRSRLEEGHAGEDKNISSKREGRALRILKDNPVFIRAYHRTLSQRMDSERHSVLQ